MRKSFIISLLLFFPLFANAITLQWVDEADRCIYRIDIQKKILEKELSSGVWQTAESINLVGVDEKEILPSSSVICLSPSAKNIRYLLIDCTHQVYQFDFNLMSLERMDKTYYRGYNCESTRFIRNDNLYSFGGYGLFRTNNLLVYFQKDTREWDAINCVNDAPRSIYKGLNGYSKQQDSFFSGLNFYHNDSENQGKMIIDFGMHEYSFKENKWIKLGEIKNSVFKEITDNISPYFHWNGQYFVIRIYKAPYNKIFIIDPVKNEVFEWEDKKRLFDIVVPHIVKEHDKEYIIGDSLYSYKTVTTGNQNYIAKQVLSLEQLKKEATLVGQVYESSKTNFWILLPVAAIALAALLFYLKKDTGKKDDFGLSEKLDKVEKDLLVLLIRNHTSEGIDTEQINTLLMLNSKTIENQRKVRHDFIKALIPKLELIYGIENPIEKVPTSVDKRIFNYKLNEALFRKLTNES